MKKFTKVLILVLLVAALATAAFALDDSTACPHCKETLEWTVWDGSAITQSGHYYLSKDVTLTTQLELSGLDVVIDLGGSTLAASETKRAFSLSNGATLSLLDTSAGKTGTVKGATNSGGGGGTIYAAGGSVVNLYSGIITGGTTDSYAAEGGTSTSHSGGNFQFEGATFNMYGGTVSDGKSSFGGNFALFSNSVMNLYGGTVTGGESSYVNANQLNQAVRGGGNLYISSGSVLNMYGGTISNGAARRVGGNVSLWTSSSTFNMYGGTVSGGTALATAGYITAERAGGVFVYRGTNYGNFYMYGGVLESTLTFYGDATDMIIYNGKLKNNPTDVVNSRGSATQRAYALASCSCYTYDGTFYTVWHTGDNAGLCDCAIDYIGKAETVYTGTHTYEDGVCANCGDAYTAAPGEPETPATPNQPGAGTCSVCNKDVTWTAWDGKTRPAEGDHFRLTASATMTEAFKVAKGESVCVDLNGFSVSAPVGERAFYVEGTLGIQDSRVLGAIKGSSHANNGGTIYVSSNGKLTINSGTISGGTADGKYGGNLYVAGTANLRDCTILGGNAARGGNIACTGTLNIYDGCTISGGIASGYGGNIYTNKNLNIYGGTITGGKSDDNAGGNLGLMYAKLVMTGGQLSNATGYNISTNGTASGGNCSLKLLGGEIVGGNIVIQSNSSAEKATIEIDGCRVDTGVLLSSGTLTMYSGYLKTMNCGKNTAIIYAGTMGIETSRVASCACEYKNADGTYTIWQTNLTDGTCATCNHTYTNASVGVHTYEAGTEQGTAACKHCDNIATGIAAVCNRAAYNSLEEALLAAVSGNTVVMVSNATVDQVVVPAGVFLDLNGYTLTANAVTAAFDGARIIDSKQTGVLAVQPENVTIVHAGNELPVMTESGIRFADVTYDREMSAVNDNQSKFKFHFTQNAKSLLAEALTKGGEDVKLVITVTYTNSKGEPCEKILELNRDLIAKYTGAWGRKQFVVTVTGTANITDLDIVVSIESCGVGVDSDTCVTGKEALDGKKVIFFGNSFTYYGKCVLDRGQSVYAQSSRVNDQGLFYQICKANGIDVNVTNFTFGGHTLEDHYSGCCNADRGHDGLEHLSYITDWNYDYVILQNGTKSSTLEDIYTECEPLIEKFRAANPDVKIVMLVHHQAYISGYNWLASVPRLEEKGVIVVNWGEIVYDVLNGNVEVPGAEQTYTKNSFIVAQSASDGYHQNVLAGYITAVSAFCKITGEKAVDQVYDFGDDHSILGDKALESYKAKYYKADSGNTYDYSTNFIEILNSDADMQGIQKLIDQYMAE